MYFWAGMLLFVGTAAMLFNFFLPDTTSKWFDVLFFITAVAVAYRIHLKEKEQKIESLEQKLQDMEEKT